MALSSRMRSIAVRKVSTEVSPVTWMRSRGMPAASSSWLLDSLGMKCSEASALATRRLTCSPADNAGDRCIASVADSSLATGMCW
jgi:hypothetical protein